MAATQSPGHPMGSEDLPNTITTARLGRSEMQIARHACVSCRAAKARCLQGDLTLQGKCQRCSKYNKECVFTALNQKRRRKRTDTRVTELENEVKQLSTLLNKQNVLPTRDNQDLVYPESPVSHEAEQHKSSRNGVSARESHQSDLQEHETFPPSSNLDSHSSTNTNLSQFLSANSTFAAAASSTTPSSTNTQPGFSVQTFDVIDRGLISLHTATSLFDRYNHEMVQHYPAIIFAAGTRANEVRRSKPVLFLAVIAAAAGTADPELNRILNEEILKIYADQVIVHGRKSLELVQAITLTIAWYYACDSSKFFQHSQMAATLVLELGIDKPGRQIWTQLDLSEAVESHGLDSQALNHHRLAESSTASIGDVETRRTLLACYVTCASISVIARRPNILPFNEWMAQCVEYLETSPDATTTDKQLAQWARLQRLAEVDSCNGHSHDSIGAFRDPNFIHSFKASEKCLRDIRRTMTAHSQNVCLEIAYHYANVYLHEAALHHDYDAQDFAPPFRIENARGMTHNHQVELSPTQIIATATCLSSTHSMLELFLGLSVDTLRAMPIVNYARMGYGMVVLLKLFVASTTGTSALGKVIDHESLEVPQYFERLLAQLMTAAESGKCRYASKFLIVLMRLAASYQRQCTKINTDERVEKRVAPIQMNVHQLDENFGKPCNWGNKDNSSTYGMMGRTQIQRQAPVQTQFAQPQVSNEPSVPSHPNGSQFQNMMTAEQYHSSDGQQAFQMDNASNHYFEQVPESVSTAWDRSSHISTQPQALPLFDGTSDTSLNFNHSFLSYMGHRGMLTADQLMDGGLVEGGLFGDLDIDFGDPTESGGFEQ